MSNFKLKHPLLPDNMVLEKENDSFRSKSLDSGCLLDCSYKKFSQAFVFFLLKLSNRFIDPLTFWHKESFEHLSFFLCTTRINHRASSLFRLIVVYNYVLLKICDGQHRWDHAISQNISIKHWFKCKNILNFW